MPIVAYAVCFINILDNIWNLVYIMILGGVFLMQSYSLDRLEWDI